MAVAMLLAMGLLFVLVRHYWPFATDDAFISFRYSERLLDGKGLTWNDGEWVEGYSNLLWVLLCAGMGLFGADMLQASRVLGVVCTVGTMLLLARRFGGSSWSAGLLPIVLAVSAPVPVWAIGGLETPLLMMLLTGGFLAVERAVAGDRLERRALLAAGGWFASACLTRPDAPLLTACAGLAPAISAWRSGQGARGAVRAVATLAAIPVIAVFLQLAFRIGYYGDYLPNTARVKLHSDEALAIAGRAYVQTAFWVFVPVVVPAVGGFLVGMCFPPARGITMTLAVAAVVWVLYTQRVGGDIFAGWRILVPALVPAVLLVGLLIERLALGGRHARWLAWVTLLSASGLSLYTARNDRQTEHATWERYEFDNRAIAAVLRHGFADEEPLLAVRAAGALPYYTRFPCLDMHGLCDPRIAHIAPRVAAKSAFAAAHPGAPPEYVLEREPDLLYLDKPVQDDEAGLALVDQPGFAADYRCVWFRCADQKLHFDDGIFRDEEFLAAVWVRVDGRVGVRRTESRVEVPAWLLGSYRHPPGMRQEPPADPDRMQQWLLDAAVTGSWLRQSACCVPVAEGVALEARRSGEYVLEGLRLRKGTWAPRLTGPKVGGATVRLSLRASASAAPLLQVGAGWQVEEQHQDGVSLVARIEEVSLPLRLQGVELMRLD